MEATDRLVILSSGAAVSADIGADVLQAAEARKAQKETFICGQIGSQRALLFRQLDLIMRIAVVAVKLSVNVSPYSFAYRTGKVCSQNHCCSIKIKYVICTYREERRCRSTVPSSYAIISFYNSR